MFGEEIEVDESYFGGRRKGRRGRGAGGKILVFGLLKRGTRQGLHQDHPERLQRQPNADHGAKDRARQYRLFRQLEGLQRARRVSL